MIGQLGNLGQLGLSGGSRQLTPRMVPGCMWEYDLYNWSTLFQDKNGVAPVTAYGQPVGLNLDLSQGLTFEGRCAIHDGTITNYFSTPDSVAASVTGDITILWSGTLASVAPSARMPLLDKHGISGNYSYSFYCEEDTGKLFADLNVNSTSTNRYTSTATLASVGITANTRVWLYVQRVAITGLTKFFYSLDGITYTQLGADVSNTAGTIYNGTAPLGVGIRPTGTVYPLTGKTYQAKIFAGIGITGTPVVDFNPSLYTSGSTFTAATGEVWTLNGNAVIVNDYKGNHRFSESAARPTLELSSSGKPYLSYNGVGKFMQTNPFAWSSDEACVIMGVRKLSDATTGFLLEYSINSTDQTNAFALVSPSTNGANSFRFYSHGNAPQVGAGTGVFAAAPTTKVIAGLGKISGDICRLYANGSLIESTLTDQGTGNYGTYALYFGARYGTGTPSLFFYGEEYSSCAFNKIPTDSQFLAVNRWANTKTGAY